METRRPLEIKLLAAVAGFFIVWPILIYLPIVFLMLGEDWSLAQFALYFRMLLFVLTYSDIFSMAAWLGLLLALLQQSRWALLFASLLSVESVLGLLASWLIGGHAEPSSLTEYVLTVVVVTALAPFFILAATIRLWRQGTIK